VSNTNAISTKEFMNQKKKKKKKNRHNTCLLKLDKNNPTVQNITDMNDTVLASNSDNSICPNGPSKLIKMLQTVATKLSRSDKFVVP
jgi:hypothetical protein